MTSILGLQELGPLLIESERMKSGYYKKVAQKDLIIIDAEVEGIRTLTELKKQLLQPLATVGQRLDRAKQLMSNYSTDSAEYSMCKEVHDSLLIQHLSELLP